MQLRLECARPTFWTSVFLEVKEAKCYDLKRNSRNSDLWGVYFFQSASIVNGSVIRCDGRRQCDHYNPHGSGLQLVCRNMVFSLDPATKFEMYVSRQVKK